MVLLRLSRLKTFRLMYEKWFPSAPRPPPYNHIVQIGDPVLRKKSSAVNPSIIKDKSMQKIFSDLCYILKVTGAAGLSACQVGVPLRIFAIQFPSKNDFGYPVLYDKRQMEYIPLKVWVNPQMKILDYTKIHDEESCESMKSFSAKVPRYNKVLLTGLDYEGKEMKWEAKGWSARIVQHEMDHLDGNFYTDQMDPKSLCCTHWDVVNKTEGRIFTTYMINK